MRPFVDRAGQCAKPQGPSRFTVTWMHHKLVALIDSVTPGKCGASKRGGLPQSATAAQNMMIFSTYGRLLIRRQQTEW